jgi:hypothetical protein
MFTASEQGAGLRNEDLRRLLARRLFTTEVGGRLPTVRELAVGLGASVGAVQIGLIRLETEGAVSIVRRGRLGAFLEQRSLPKLWVAAESAPLVIALPLPSNLRGQGLASGLKTVISDAGIDTYMTFVRGSRTRLRALREGRCHVAVMSEFAAAMACGPDERIARLAPNTFALERRVFYDDRRRDPSRRLRVVIDRDSADLQRLAELEFEDQDVEFVPAVYMQFVRLIEDGLADAAVWDMDETTLRLPQHILSRPLSARVKTAVGDTDTRAALVTRRDDPAATAVVDGCLTDSRVAEVQRDVLSGTRVPGY